LVLVLAVIVGFCTALPMRPIDLASLTERANVIIVGQILSVSGEGQTTIDLNGQPTSAATGSCLISVDHVFKGDLAMASVKVKFLKPNLPLNIPEITQGRFGIFFVSRTDDEFAFTEMAVPYLPAVNSIRSYAGSVLDQVTMALGQVLIATGVEDAERNRALDALRRLHTDLAADELREALKSASGEFRLEVARSLVARNDISGLPMVEQTLLKPGQLPEATLLNVAGSLSGLKDPRAVPTLARIVQAGPLQARRPASYALRRTDSPSALRPLSQLLNDPDPEVRYNAVAGMGEITHQDEWTPAKPEFYKNEVRYLSYWRRWAESNLN
jgi:hypothetical protein